MRVKEKFRVELVTVIGKDSSGDLLEKESHPISSLLNFNMILGVKEVRLGLFIKYASHI